MFCSTRSARESTSSTITYSSITARATASTTWRLAAQKLAKHSSVRHLIGHLDARAVRTHLNDTFTQSSCHVQRSEEHTSELQSRGHLVCRLLLEKKKTQSAHRRANETMKKRDRVSNMYTLSADEYAKA